MHITATKDIYRIVLSSEEIEKSDMLREIFECMMVGHNVIGRDRSQSICEFLMKKCAMHATARVVSEGDGAVIDETQILTSTALRALGQIGLREIYQEAQTFGISKQEIPIAVWRETVEIMNTGGGEWQSALHRIEKYDDARKHRLGLPVCEKVVELLGEGGQEIIYCAHCPCFRSCFILKVFHKECSAVLSGFIQEIEKHIQLSEAGHLL